MKTTRRDILKAGAVPVAAEATAACDGSGPRNWELRNVDAYGCFAVIDLFDGEGKRVLDRVDRNAATAYFLKFAKPEDTYQEFYGHKALHPPASYAAIEDAVNRLHPERKGKHRKHPIPRQMVWQKYEGVS